MNGLSVVIPSRNAVNLAACVKAVWQHQPGVRIIVVDDGVDWMRYIDESPDQVRAVMDNSVTGEKPFVFARNANIGIRAAGSDDVILLNDDALLRSYCGFSEMQRLAYAPWKDSAGYSQWGIVAAACNTVGNQNQFQRREPEFRIMFRAEHRMVCFVCVLIPRHTIDAVGLLDERFVDYGLDDDDYCLRVRNAGIKLGIFDGCYVDHGSLQSSFRGPVGAGGDFSANMRRFIEKWGFDNWGRPRETSQFARLFPPEETMPRIMEGA